MSGPSHDSNGHESTRYSSMLEVDAVDTKPPPRYIIGAGSIAQQTSQTHITEEKGTHHGTPDRSIPNQSTTYQDASTRDAVATGRAVDRQPTLTEKARAVVDGKTEEVRERINEATQGLQKELNPDSHELARENPAIQGAVTQHAAVGTDGVTDIGWHMDTSTIPDPLIEGISNGAVFAFIRRFNKDVFDVRSVPMEVTSGLDLNESWAPDYATEKIPLQLQRLYLTFVLGIASLIRQTSRLRSWRETRRTAAFCAAYLVAWLLDLLVPLFLGMLIAVVCSKKARDTLFPPAPLALVDISKGTLKKPQAKQLGTFNTLTGAPEKHEGEAVEQEAANFADNIRHLITRSVGVHKSQDEGGDPLEGKVPKPVRNAVRKVQAEGQAAGHVQEEEDPVQKPMEEMLWDKVKPEKLDPILKNVPHVLGELADNYERFANAINPTPPFSPYSYLRIAAILVPMFLMSFFVNYYMVYKGIGAGIGFALFGDPILTPAWNWLNRNYPHWMEQLEPKNNILRGVPTNNQIALTLLRIGEAYKAPLPPVPASKSEDSYQKKHLDVDEIPLDASRAEKTFAVTPDISLGNPPAKDDEGPKHKHVSKLVRFFKGESKAVVESKLAIDHVRAAAGSEKAKGHLGVLPKEKNLVYAGPSEFKARYEGKPGWLYITETAEPELVFTKHDPRPVGAKSPEQAVLTIPIKEIKRLKRATAFASQPAEVVADYSEDKELLGSLEISTADTNQANDVYRFTAIPERDELFNRLVAIGQQRWENM
ncbi:hypothetical protein BR93DRAFT_899550 [Coniochaeta sp. PMI_546]|nr:hypothetical protein BR93DRAFT_899550 [Coniochaeta sp. PMI_546]